MRLGHELREHIDPGVQQVADDVSVVATHVLLLGERAIEEASRLKIEFAHANVGGQVAAPHWLHIRELRVATEEPLAQRLNESSLEVGLPAGLAKRKRREDP